MKRTTILFVSAFALAGGCSQVRMTPFEYQAIRLEVGGRLSRQGVATRDPQPGVYYMLDGPPLQIHIEAKLISASRTDQSILGIRWWPGQGRPLDPIRVEDTTPHAPPITLGFGMGMSSGGNRGDSRCSQCGSTDPHHSCGDRSGGSGVNTGMGVGFPVGGEDRSEITSVRTTFLLDDFMNIDDSWLMVLIQTGTTADKKIIAQPLLLPITIDVPQPNGAAPTPQKIATHVLVRDGETFVIGGQKKPSTEEALSKVPILGDLPVLGRLFRESDTIEKKELLIFLEPRILLIEE